MAPYLSTHAGSISKPTPKPCAPPDVLDWTCQHEQAWTSNQNSIHQIRTCKKPKAVHDANGLGCKAPTSAETTLPSGSLDTTKSAENSLRQGRTPFLHLAYSQTKYQMHILWLSQASVSVWFCQGSLLQLLRSLCSFCSVWIRAIKTWASASLAHCCTSAMNMALWDGLKMSLKALSAKLLWDSCISSVTLLWTNVVTSWMQHAKPTCSHVPR